MSERSPGADIELSCMNVAEKHGALWLTIKSQTESVTSDVRRIGSHPLVAGSVPIYGYVYDVKNGRLVEVPEATRVGRPG